MVVQEMSEACVSNHKVVYLTYEIHGPTGELLERSDIPIGYVHGANSDLFEKIEHNLEGCSVGDTVEVTLTPEEGFGRFKPELTYTDDIQNVPPEYRHVGAEVTFANDRGETITMVVSHIEGNRLTVDGNHPFAGKTVTFTVRVFGIRDATDDEIRNGVPADGANILH